MPPTRAELRFAALPSRVADWATEVERALPPPHRGDATRLGIAEALANAIVHGALGLSSHRRDTGDIEAFLDAIVDAEARHGEERFVDVEVLLDGDGATVVVTDPGAGFDWRDPPRGEGRGLAMIARIFEDVSWNESGNQVRLELGIRPAASSRRRRLEQGAP
jgi:anti-sigma regulatory factor (Ser/Thr protein kinase)